MLLLHKITYGIITECAGLKDYSCRSNHFYRFNHKALLPLASSNMRMQEEVTFYDLRLVRFNIFPVTSNAPTAGVVNLHPSFFLE